MCHCYSTCLNLNDIQMIGFYSCSFLGSLKVNVNGTIWHRAVNRPSITHSPRNSLVAYIVVTWAQGVAGLTCTITNPWGHFECTHRDNDSPMMGKWGRLINVESKDHSAMYKCVLQGWANLITRLIYVLYRVNQARVALFNCFKTNKLWRKNVLSV